ncbi:hypothetical protein Tco_0666197 [Tanacetum coccineum]
MLEVSWHKGRILEPTEKLKGRSRSRSPRPSSRHRGDYRDIDRLTNPSISRDRSEYDRPRARDRDRYRNRSRSKSPDYRRECQRSRYDDDDEKVRSWSLVSYAINHLAFMIFATTIIDTLILHVSTEMCEGNAHHGNEILPKLKQHVAAAACERKKQMLVDYMAPLHTNCNTTIVLLPQQGTKKNFRTSTMKQAAENAHEFGDQVHVIDVENSSTRESNNYKIFQVK